MFPNYIKTSSFSRQICHSGNKNGRATVKDLWVSASSCSFHMEENIFAGRKRRQGPPFNEDFAFKAAAGLQFCRSYSSDGI